MTIGGNGENGNGESDTAPEPAPAQTDDVKEILEQQYQDDPEGFADKWGADEPEESGDPHKQ